jgi:hypothetical protein
MYDEIRNEIRNEIKNDVRNNVLFENKTLSVIVDLTLSLFSARCFNLF